MCVALETSIIDRPGYGLLDRQSDHDRSEARQAHRGRIHGSGVRRRPMRRPKADRPPSSFPRWGSIALPGSALWGTVLGLLIGAFFGNFVIGAMIGAGLGIGIGLALFAAAIVMASKDF